MKLKSKLSKLISGFTAAVMCFTMLPNVPTSSAANIGDKLTVGNGMNQHKGVCDGYSYEAWIDTTGGSGSMTLGAGGTFKAEWNASVSRGNFLARRDLTLVHRRRLLIMVQSYLIILLTIVRQAAQAVTHVFVFTVGSRTRVQQAIYRLLSTTSLRTG